MTEIQPFVFPATGQQVRSVLIDAEPWFVALDVTTALGYANGRDAVSKLPERMRNSVALADGNRGNPNHVVINEAGVWRLTMRSTLPAAEAFQDWLAEEVIPSIRRTGSYALASASGGAVAPATVNALAELAHREHVVPMAGRVLAYERWHKSHKGLEAFVQLTIDLGLPGVDGGGNELPR
jgi:prophage antirepressor-like protein